MSGGIGFSDPRWLVLLPPLALLILWALRTTRAKLPRQRARIAAVLRFSTLAAVVAALAGLTAWKPEDRLTVVFAVDGSRSIAGDARRTVSSRLRQLARELPRSDRAGVVVFGEQAMVDRYPSEDWSGGEVLARPGENGTDIAAAVGLSRGLFAPQHEARLVLLTDGVETSGSVEDALAGLSESVDVVWWPLERSAQRDVLVERISVPSRILEDQPHRVRVVVRASEPTAATLRVFRGSTIVSAARVQLRADQPNVFALEQIAPTAAGMLLYRAEVEVEGDVEVENNRASGLVRVEGRPRLLLVDTAPASLAPWAQALSTAGFRVDRVTPGSLPSDPVALTAYDGVVFADVAATDLSEGQMVALQRYVSDVGGGFLMLGGPDSFGPGGYWGTPVEEMLPLDMEAKDWRQHPSLGLILCIDKSGSMAGSVTTAKIEVAKAAAAEVASQLTPMDRIGVVAFDQAAKWVVPPVSGGDKDEVTRRLGTLRAGGGTDAYPALEQAHRALSEMDARVKHVILLTDGQLQARDHEGLARGMEREGITVSTVGVGSDADMYTLERIAHAGGGHFYPAREVVRLPRIFLREAFRLSRAWLVEERFAPVGLNPHELLSGIDVAELPPLDGYVAASEKNRAQHLLATHRGDPLLSAWRYGLGKSAAFTSDVKGRWNTAWMDWPDYVPFWSRFARWLIRERESDERLRVEASTRDGKLRVAADLLDRDGSFVNGASLQATVLGPDGERRSVRLEQVGPGRYAGQTEASRPGAYLAAVAAVAESRGADEGLGATASAVVPYSGEFIGLHRAPEGLERLVAAGRVRVMTEREDLFVHRGPGGRIRWSLVPWLLMLGSFFLVGEVGVRKLKPDPSWRLWRRAKVPSAAPERFQRLQDARLRVRRRVPVQPPGEVSAPVDVAPTREDDPRSVPDEPKPSQDAPTHTSRLLERKRRRTRQRGGTRESD